MRYLHCTMIFLIRNSHFDLYYLYSNTIYYFIGYVINFHCSFGTPLLVLSLACDIILQEALFSCPHRLHLSILPRTAESLSFSFRRREKLFQLTIHKKADFEGGRKVDYLIFVSTHSPTRGLTIHRSYTKPKCSLQYGE